MKPSGHHNLEGVSFLISWNETHLKIPFNPQSFPFLYHCALRGFLDVIWKNRFLSLHFREEQTVGSLRQTQQRNQIRTGAEKQHLSFKD